MHASVCVHVYASEISQLCTACRLAVVLAINNIACEHVVEIRQALQVNTMQMHCIKNRSSNRTINCPWPLAVHLPTWPK